MVAGLKALNTTTTDSISCPLLKSTSRSIAIEMRLAKQLKFFLLCAFLLCLMEPSFVEAQKPQRPPSAGVVGKGLGRRIRFVEILLFFLLFSQRVLLVLCRWLTLNFALLAFKGFS